MRKKAYEEIKNYIEVYSNSGCKLISTKEEYTDTHCKIKCMCKCTNEFTTTFHSIIRINKLKCNECSFKASSEKQRNDGNMVYNLFIEKGYIPQFKPEDYKNAKQKLPYICKKHENKGIQFVNYSNLTRMLGCKHCRTDSSISVKKLDINKVYELFYLKNLTPLFSSEDYKNTQSKLSFKCNIHPEEIQYVTYGSLSENCGCKACGLIQYSEKRRNNIDDVKSVFQERNYEYDENNVYTNNLSILKYKCNKHPELGWQETNYANVKKAKTCVNCMYQNITGENHYFWKGGISPLQNYLRDKINKWKRDSLIAYNFSCSITGIHSNKLIVHHLYGYNKILDETLNELNLPIHSIINQYSKEELSEIEELLLKKHYEYGLGVPMLDIVHNLFHSVQSKGNNVPEEFEEFQTRLKSGEFDDFLKENNLKLVI